MTKVTISRFDGGHAEDIRTHNTNECEKSLNFDVFTNPHKLIPYGDSILETTASATMADIKIADVDIVDTGSGYKITGFGAESAVSAKPTFWTKSSMISTFTSSAVGASGTYVTGSYVVYKDKGYALAYDGSVTYTLYQYTGAGSVTSIGTITATSSSIHFYARPFVHPLDTLLYIVIGNVIARYNGTTLTSYPLILPTAMEATSLTDYGSYLAIGMHPFREAGSSIVYLWDRDSSLSIIDSNVDFGIGDLRILENINNNLVAVMTPYGNYTSTITNKLTIKAWSGGNIDIIKQIAIPSGYSLAFFKAKTDSKLYFGFNNDDAFYVLGRNKEGNYIITKDRYYFNGVTIGTIVRGFAIIGDVIWRGFNTVGAVYKLMRSMISDDSVTYSSTSLYKTTINPVMPIEDRYKDKQLNWVRVAYFSQQVGATTVVKYSADGSTLATIISDTNIDSGEKTQLGENESDGKPLLNGREFQFQLETTGGNTIKEITYDYTILPTA